jgi:glycosyltransferase involved in cell wall biosynthesis
VHFLGHQSRAELARLLPACDAFVHSNPSEPFGIGPLEAMAAGLPLVAPDRGGVKHYANSENAWLAEPNPTGFADAILAVVSDRASRQARILAARRTAQNHDWARAGSYFLSLYRDILCTTRRQAGQPLSKPLFTSNRARLPARI